MMIVMMEMMIKITMVMTMLVVTGIPCQLLRRGSQCASLSGVLHPVGQEECRLVRLEVLDLALAGPLKRGSVLPHVLLVDGAHMRLLHRLLNSQNRKLHNSAQSSPCVCALICVVWTCKKAIFIPWLSRATTSKACDWPSRALPYIHMVPK
jgi:hypothetical protein